MTAEIVQIPHFEDFQGPKQRISSRVRFWEAQKIFGVNLFEIRPFEKSEEKRGKTEKQRNKK